MQEERFKKQDKREPTGCYNYAMRRKDREVCGFEKMLEIVRACKVCRLGLLVDGAVYIVPLNFGLWVEGEQLRLFFHSAKEGFKVDAMRTNPLVSFEMDCEHALVESNNACGVGFGYASVMGKGSVRFIDDLSEKLEALQAIMLHQTGREWDLSGVDTESVLVYELQVSTMTGKRRIFPGK